MTSSRFANLRLWASWLAIFLLIAAAAPFAFYAADIGVAGLNGGGDGWYRFHRLGAETSSAAIFAHMAAGGAITVLAPLQMIGAVRRKWPVAHKALGWLIIVSAMIAAVGGLAYILLRSTVGGLPMDIAFGVYGGLMGLAAVQAVRHARARRFDIHRRWALRLIVLALGSWPYRVQYGLWEVATGGIWRAPDFSGAFDLFQLYAFYVPWLLLLELWFWRERRLRAQRA